LRIGRNNFRLLSDISYKESALQLVYDVLRLTPFFKAFLVIADVLEIYMQEFWATATVHHHSIRFKMDNKKHIINLESFRKMLHICQRLPGQSFVEPSFKEEIIAFLWFLRHSRAIRRLTDVEHKDTKKSTETYYPRISDAYKEYYAVATGATPPKPKASVRKTRSSSDTTVTPPTAVVGPRLSTSAKGKQPAITSKAKSLSALLEWSSADEGTSTIPGVLDVPTDDSEEGDDNDDDEGDDGDDGEEENNDDDDDEQDDDDQEDERDDDEDDQEEGGDDGEQGQDEEDEEDELYRDININLGRGSSSVSSQFVTSMLNPTPDAGIESIFKPASQMDVQTPTLVATIPVSTPTLTTATIATITTTLQAPTPPTTAPSTLLQDLPNFGSLFGFNHRLKTLEENFSEFMQTNQFAGAVSSILEIVLRYMDQRMNEAVKVDVQIQSNHLRDEALAENDEFLKTIDENMQKIIKDQVKEQVKVQVSKILSKIEQTVNEQLEAEVLTRSSNSSKTSYVVDADLSEMELKKILIEKIEGNKSIHRSNEQRNLYKALVEAYESDKIILDTYGDTVTLKRRHNDDADKDEEPSAGSDRGSKGRREGKEPESASAPKKKHPEWFSQQKKPPTLDRDWNKTLPATHGSIQPWISKLAKQSDSRSSFNELMDTPVDFSAFLMNRLKVDTLTPELLAGPTYELMKGSCKSLVELEFFLEEVYNAMTNQLDWVNPKGQQYPHNLLKPLPLIPNNRGRHVIPFNHFINNDLEYLCGGASSRKYTTSVTKTKVADYGHIKWIEDWGRKRQQFYGFAVNRESARDVYSKRRITAVTELKIVEWHNYKHLDWITGYPLVSIEVLMYDKRSKIENMGIVPTEMELILEHAQQGISHEVSFSLNYEPEPGYIQNYNSYPRDSPSFPQQYPRCEDFRATHEPYQCQPKNEDYHHGQNSCYDSTSIGFDQSQPQQYTVNHPIFNAHNDVLKSQTMIVEQMTQLTSMCEMLCQIVQKKREEKQIEEEQVAKAQKWKLPVCYDDDDDKESYNSLNDNIIFELPPCVAVTPNEPVDSLIMEDEHLDTISATKSDEFIKSSVENLVPNPSESEGESECDVPAGYTTFSNVLFDADYDSDSSDDQSLSDEDVPEKIYSNPLFDEEIIPIEIDPHSFSAESDLIESMPNHDSSIIISLKIDSIFDEFAGELTLLKSIPPRIDETNCHPEEEIRLTKRLLYDNSSLRPLEEIVSNNSHADIESFSPSPIPIKDSDLRMEEIDSTFNPDDLMPPGIEEDDDDSERDIPILDELLNNYSLSLPNNESYHFDIPSPSRPPAKPPDGNTGSLNIKIMGDNSEQQVPIPGLSITRVSNQEESPDLLPHLGLEIFQPSAECPKMINGKNTPVLDVPLFYFPP
nr:hypothetical protein [Tanacetum cinerariifolium]